MSISKNLEDVLSMGAVEVAPLLLGAEIIRVVDGKKMVGKIVETEAYDQADAASHSFNGMTPRTEVMFGPPGHMYVCFIYGMHYCCNIVCGPEGYGSAVLIRGIEPFEGEEYMAQNRLKQGVEVTNGPAKLCQALRIDKSSNGQSLDSESLKLVLRTPIDPKTIAQTTRIGISRAQDEPWRFYIKGNPYVSKQ